MKPKTIAIRVLFPREYIEAMLRGHNISVNFQAEVVKAKPKKRAAKES